MKTIGVVLITLVLISGMVGCPAAVRYELSISSTEGGSVTEPGEGTYTYSEGRVVILRAEAEQGYHFVNWTGSVDQISDVNAATTTITVNAHRAAIANFEAISVVRYDLAISSTDGGSVTTPGEGAFQYEAGMVVSLMASPATGYRFVNWTGDVATIGDVNSAETTIGMNGNYQVSANFEEEEEAVHFADPNLDAAIREAIGVHGRPIYPSDLEMLTHLSALGMNIADLTGLEHCTSLTDLSLSGNQITCIAPLGHLTSLRDLSLSRNQIANISPLAHLTNLTSLSLHSNQIGNTELAHLAGLTRLTTLYIGGNPVTDTSPLANLTNLTWLSLQGMGISDISPVASLTNLTHLDLWDCQVEDVAPLAGLTDLTWLRLKSNKVVDISPLADLTSLAELVLDFNQVCDIAPLASITSLTWLSLTSNQISDVSPLANLTNLTMLWLGFNQISDVSPLANLTNLTMLWLGYNQISDLSSLVDNPKLGEGDVVWLTHNPLSEQSINQYIPALQARGVTVVY